MGSLIGRFLALVTFNAGPQDLPFSVGLRNQVVLLHVVLGFLVAVLSQPATEALVAALLSTGVMVAVAAGIPWAHGFAARVTQTITALGGAGVIFSLLSWPVVWVLERTFQANGEPGAVPLLALLVLLIWNLAVVAHVFRHSLSRGLGVGAVYALLYLVAVVLVTRLVMPAG